MSLVASWGVAKAQQNAVYCNITGVQVQRLSNAVQVTIEADGIMDIARNWGDFFDMDALSRGNWDYFGKKVNVLPFKIMNARARVPSFTDVGVYPVSHVEVAVFPDSIDGVGVDVKVQLFTEAIPISVKTPYGPSMAANDWKTPLVWIKLTGDQRKIIITVTSDRKVSKPAEHRKPTASQKPILEISTTKDRVSLTAMNVSIADLARELGDKTHTSLVVDKGIDRYVSLSMADVTLDQVLDSLARTYGFTIEQSGQTIRIGNEQVDNLSAYESSRYEKIPLRNMKAADIRSLFPEFLLRFIRVDNDHNTLTLSGSKQLIEKVKEDVAKLDQKPPMIAVEAVGVEFGSVLEAQAFLNLLYQWNRNTISLDSLTGDMAYTFAGKLPQNWTSQVSALKDTRKSKIYSKPVIRLLNGKSSELFLGRQQLVKYSFFDMYDFVWKSQILRVNVGSSIGVTAWSGGGDQILVKVEPSLTTITDLEAGTGLPTIANRKASTMLRIKDGETLILGGMSIDQKAASKLGLLGTSPSNKNSSTELVWFITARIEKNDAEKDNNRKPTYGT